MIMILGFVINSFQHDTELVAEDYYAQEIAYQNRMEQQSNAIAVDIQTSFNDGGLVLQYPQNADQWSGKIAFFRPSNQHLDFELPIKADESLQQHIAQDQLIAGLWRLKFYWKEQGKEYYVEKSVVAP